MRVYSLVQLKHELEEGFPSAESFISQKIVFLRVKRYFSLSLSFPTRSSEFECSASVSKASRQNATCSTDGQKDDPRTI